MSLLASLLRKGLTAWADSPRGDVFGVTLWPFAGLGGTRWLEWAFRAGCAGWGELPPLALAELVLFGVPVLIDPLNRFRWVDPIRLAVLWLSLALVRTGVALWWRRRREGHAPGV